VIIAYNHAHPALSARRASNGSGAHDCALEATRTRGISTAPQKLDQGRFKSWLIRPEIPIYFMKYFSDFSISYRRGNFEHCQGFRSQDH
jgi:hypothetical protein